MQQNIEIPEAIELLSSLLPQPKTEIVTLMQAHGAVLAEALTAKASHPSLDDSALDGFAVRFEDTQHASLENPVRLKIIGLAVAGAAPINTKIFAGEAIKIFTGAPVPAGTTGIVMVENTKTEADTVLIFKPSTPDIRKAGQDLEVGQTYLQPGTILRAPHIALAAAMGHEKIKIYKKPRITIFSTGDEIIEPGKELPPGGAYNSNAYGLAALVHELGGEANILPRIPDNLEALSTQLEQAPIADLFLTSGGVSMGERDVVRQFLEQNILTGLSKIHFWRLNIKPGGPALLGEFAGKKIFGLPGNPVASLIVFMAVVRPAIYKTWGILEPPHQTVAAKAETVFMGVKNKTSLLRASLGFKNDAYAVRAFDNQSSGVLRSLTESNALVVLPPNQNVVVGEMVQVMVL